MAATWRLGTASMVLATVWTMEGRVAEAQLAPLTLPLAVHDYAALPRPVPWGYLLRPSLVASVVAASSIAGAAAQSGIAVTAKAPRVDRWPCRIVAASTLREAFEQGWERSKTIRGQCEELAGARAVVALEWVVATDSLSLAKTAMAVRGGVVAATVRIPPVGETIVLLAHELQHVIEKARGLDLEAEAKRPDSGVWKAAGGYETQGAIAVSREVAAELRVVAIGPTTSGRTDEVGPSKGRQSATSIQPPTGGHLVGFTYSRCGSGCVLRSKTLPDVCVALNAVACCQTSQMHQGICSRRPSSGSLSIPQLTFSSSFGLWMAALKRSAGGIPPRSPSRVAASFSSAEGTSRRAVA